MHVHVSFQSNPPLVILLLVLPLLLFPLCPVGFVNGNSSGSQSLMHSRWLVEEWVFISDEPSDGQNTVEVPGLHSTDHSDCISETPRISKQFTSLPWEHPKPQEQVFCNRNEVPLPPLRPRPKYNFIQPRQRRPFLEREPIYLLHGSRRASTKSWSSTWWMFRRLQHNFARRQKGNLLHLLAETSSSKHFASRSIVQRKLSIYNWDPGPRRCKEDAFERQITER